MGQAIFTTSGDFTVPEGVSNVSICLIAGGSAGDVSVYGGGTPLGGHAGEVISDPSVPVTPLAVMPVVIGLGGAAVTDPGSAPSYVSGNVGTNSSFATRTAIGGVNTGFTGDGEAVTTCAGTSTNGRAYPIFEGTMIGGWGGQSSGKEPGGCATYGAGADLCPTDAGVGGGGGARYSNAPANIYSGKGGDGYLDIRWDDPLPDTNDFYLNGELILTDGHNMVMLGYNIQQLFVSGTQVWSTTVSGTEAIFAIPGDHSFTVPAGITSINACIVGAGGSGNSISFGELTQGGGGYSGQLVQETLTVVPEDVLNITVGAGGVGVTTLVGNAGGASLLGSTSAPGGAPGANGGFHGHGEAVPSPCEANTYFNGIGGGSWGGQASPFASGGDSKASGNLEPGPGSKGSGGGGMDATGTNTGPSGKGGDGYVKLSW